MTQARYIGMTLLIWVGTRFLNLWEKPGDLGDQVPSDVLGEDDEEEVGEYIAKLCLNDASRMGDFSEAKMHFSSSIGADGGLAQRSTKVMM